MFFSLVQIMSLDSQSKFQIFTLFSGCMLVSKLGSVNLPKTFQWISEVREHTETQNVKKCLFFLSPITLQFLNFIHWIVLDLFFHCVTVKTIYSIKLNLGGRLLKNTIKDKMLTNYYTFQMKTAGTVYFQYYFGKTLHW